jgi:ACS family hexuronate transporter-like MFS transporter
MTGSQPTARVAFDKQQTCIAVLLFFMILLNYLDRQILSVLAPVMRKEIGLSQTQYASAVNAFLLAYALMYAGSGLILDRFGARVGLAVFVGLWSIASGLHALVQGFASLVVFRFLLGLTEPGGWTGAAKTISERFSAAQRGLASGVFTTGAGIGAVIAPPLVVFLSLTYGWRTAFLLAAVAGLFWVPLWLRATRHDVQPRSLHSTTDSTGFIHRFRELGNKRVLAYVVTRFFGDSSGYFFLFWLPEYLVTSKSFTFTMLGTLGWIPFFWQDLGSLFGGYASSWLVQRGRQPLLSRKLMMTAAAVLVAVGTLFQATSSSFWILLALSLSSFGVGIWAGNLHAVPADGFPAQRVATVHGLAGSAGAVGGIVFNTLVGHFSARANYTAVFLMLALLQPIGVTALWLWAGERSDSPEIGEAEPKEATNLPAR